MRSHRFAPAAAALILAFGIPGLSGNAGAVPITYNFEGFNAGMILCGVEPDGTIASDPCADFDLGVIGRQATNSLCIFDSAHPTGGDTDLGTPNYMFGGPGHGDGGLPGMPGENRKPQGKVLIIPENLVDVNHDGIVDSPDDNDHGGVITIQWMTPGRQNSMTFLDIEEGGGTIDCYRGDQIVQSFPIPALGDNSQVRVNTVTNSIVDRTVVTLAGSGALAEMTFDVFVVPVEPVTWSSVKVEAGR